MSGRPPRCPRANCGRFLVRKTPNLVPPYWWCPRCAKRVSPKNVK